MDGDRVRISWVLETVMVRLNRAGLSGGDVEEGRGGACRGHPQFFSFKWGVHQTLRLWIPSPPFLAWCRAVGHPVDFRDLGHDERIIGVATLLAACLGMFFFFIMLGVIRLPPLWKTTLRNT